MKYDLKKSLLLSVGAALVSAGFAAPAWAQSDLVEEDNEARLSTVLVEGRRVDEATPLAIDLVQFGNQVQLITAEKIETGGFTNFGEAAAGLIRGANIGYSPDEGEFTIRIDGGTDRDTLLLVDGVPYFDRSSPPEDLWPATAIDPRMIQSVEIYRGGQSLYFGSNGGLGVVSVKTKEPDGTSKGQFGVYAGSFKTREIYGNYAFPIDRDGKHSFLVFGRSYHSDAHELFDVSAYGDNVLALGGFQPYPYDFNSIGAKYLWQIDESSELRLGASFSTIDFHDSFPNSTIYTPNFTEFPIYTANYKKTFSDDLRIEIDSHWQKPQLKNHELLARVCRTPRLQDLPADIREMAAGQGITGFSNAAQFEAFAATVPGLPAGCVTNPFGPTSGAATGAQNGFLVNQDPDSPFFGQPYGTLQNPFPIGAPIGYISETTTVFGDNTPNKGFGTTDNRRSGYIDYGINARATYRLNDLVELVGGVQYSGYKDASDASYGVQDVTVSSTGVYGDLRLSLPVLEGLNISLAARQDFNEGFDDQSIYKVGVRQNLPGGLYARASGGTSYSAPKIDEIGAFGANQNLNPGLQPQSVEALNAGIGIDGSFRGATYNLEFGYFQTDIENLFGTRAIETVCPQFAGNPFGIDIINRNRQSIVPPDAFCATADRLGLDGSEVVAINTLAKQEIEGFTIDFAFDYGAFSGDLSYTMMDSLEPNPVFGLPARLDGTTTNLDFVTPGAAGANEKRQSSERPEWTLSALLTYKPTDQWIFALNPRVQGTEWAWAPTTAARLVDASGNRVVDDVNFGDYFVLNGSIQYFFGKDRQHRVLVRGVNLLDESYFERYSGGAGLTLDRAVVRGEVGVNDSAYYRQYGWNGKPRSAWIQYEYRF